MSNRSTAPLRHAPICAALLLASCAPRVLAAPAATEEAADAKAVKTVEAKTAPIKEIERVLLLDDFEGDAMNWTAFRIAPETGFGADLEGKTEITRDAKQVKNGQGSLVHIYTADKGHGSLLTLERPLDLTEMRSASFWIKCDAATTFAFALREKGGARYQTTFFCPAKQWRRISLGLDALKRADDTPNANGKLDLNEIAGVYFMDLSGLLLPLAPGQEGSRIMWLDDVKFSSLPVGGDADGKLIDDFESDATRWIPITMSQNATKAEVATTGLDILADEGDAKNHALHAAYDRKPDVINVWMSGVSGAALKDSSELSLRLKTSSDATLLLSVTQLDGSRYETVLPLKATDGWKTVTQKLADLKRAPGSATGDEKLLPERIKEIALADLSIAIPGNAAAPKNELWLDDVRFE